VDKKEDKIRGEMKITFYLLYMFYHASVPLAKSRVVFGSLRGNYIKSGGCITSSYCLVFKEKMCVYIKKALLFGESTN
jgi:hypothetical protein